MFLLMLFFFVFFFFYILKKSGFTEIVFVAIIFNKKKMKTKIKFKLIINNYPIINNY